MTRPLYLTQAELLELQSALAPVPWVALDPIKDKVREALEPGCCAYCD